MPPFPGPAPGVQQACCRPGSTRPQSGSPLRLTMIHPHTDLRMCGQSQADTAMLPRPPPPATVRQRMRRSASVAKRAWTPPSQREAQLTHPGPGTDVSSHQCTWPMPRLPGTASLWGRSRLRGSCTWQGSARRRLPAFRVCPLPTTASPRLPLKTGPLCCTRSQTPCTATSPSPSMSQTTSAR